jgi:outer membrane immunogenic protein
MDQALNKIKNRPLHPFPLCFLPWGSVTCTSFVFNCYPTTKRRHLTLPIDYKRKSSYWGPIMKKQLLAGVAFAGLIVPATAAQPSAPVYPRPIAVPLYSWAGFYAGANGGYGWGRDGTVTPHAAGFVTGPLLVDTSAELTANVASLSPLGGNPKGALGGLQAGYNCQFNHVVVGFEADYSWSHIDGSQSAFLIAPVVVPALGGNVANISTAITASQALKSFGTLRGRFGTAFDRTLLYLTGGIAYGQASSSLGIAQTHTLLISGTPDTFFPSIQSGFQTRVGWTIGGGGEWAFANNWSVKAEYLYYDLGTLSYAQTPITGIVNSAPLLGVRLGPTTEFRGSIARVGLNYKFGYAGVPVIGK